jgi:hypothetical protein
MSALNWLRLAEVKADLLEKITFIESDVNYTTEMAVLDLLEVAKKIHEIEGDVLHDMSKVVQSESTTAH